MSYSSYNNSSDASWFYIIMCFVLVIAIVLGANYCTASRWNDGVCPKCEIRYELRGASDGLKYYSCPACGLEVSRF